MKLLKMITAYRSMTNSKKRKIKDQLSIATFAFMLAFVAFMTLADPSIEEEPDGRFLITQYTQLTSDERIMNLAERHCTEMSLALSGYKVEKNFGSGRHRGTTYYHYFSCD